MKNQAKQSVLNVKPYIPGKPIEEVKRELGLKDVIKLASNENPFPPSPKVMRALEAAASSINRYPDGDCFYLRSEIAKRLGINPKQIVFGNGSDEIIVFAAKAFLSPGDEVVLAKPTFLIYDIASTIEGARLFQIPLINFRYDLGRMKKAISPRTKIIFIGNPDNPSGQYIRQNEFEWFMDGIKDNVLIFMDQAYFEYVEAKDYAGSIDLLKRYKNLIITRTFSKLYGLAGLRVGYGIASEEIIDILNRVREPFNINSLAQAAALAALKDEKYYLSVKSKIEKERKLLYAGFKRLKLDFVETCTNFSLIKISGDSTDIVNKLLSRGVIVRDMKHWGMTGFIRSTIGNNQENKKLIKALETIL
ncbi:MAG: histidinol-phosphate transaminase [Candidatus Omnitrophica bacterium]|nr:histidinol-phosphate transaminase [Candidatus Omnitrophota bacterium]